LDANRAPQLKASVGQQLSANFRFMKLTSYRLSVQFAFLILFPPLSAYSQTAQFGTISGRVIDADSTPAFQMEVRAIKADDALTDSDAVFAKDRIFSYVDQSGTYKLNYLTAGRYFVVANADFRRPYAVTFHPGVTEMTFGAEVTVVAGAEAQNINILLGGPSLTSHSITGVCVWDDGRPAADMYVNLLVAKYPWSAPSSSSTNKDGTFKLNGYEGIEYLIDLPDYHDGKKPRVDVVKISPTAGANRVRLVLHPR
jgi:hypothetical protein